MDKIIELLGTSPFAANLFLVIITIAFLVVIIIFITAFIQGREITFWPPKIGLQPEKKPSKTVASQDKEYRSPISPSASNDLLAYNIGIEHIWPSRDAWLADQENGLVKWQKDICQARQIDIVSITFWRNWMEKELFVKNFSEHLQLNGVKARILIYHPGASIMKLRAHHEKPMLDHPEREMQIEIKQTLQAIVDIKKKLLEISQSNIEVRLTCFYYLMAQIIRADDKMIVSNYLSKKGGHPIPTFQVAGIETKFFTTYKEQFDILWEDATPFEGQFGLIGDVTSPLSQETDRCLKLLSANNWPSPKE